jgi:hypothetical protein
VRLADDVTALAGRFDRSKTSFVVPGAYLEVVIGR